jgi:hypothetical protein
MKWLTGFYLGLILLGTRYSFDTQQTRRATRTVLLLVEQLQLPLKRQFTCPALTNAAPQGLDCRSPEAGTPATGA